MVVVQHLQVSPKCTQQRNTYTHENTEQTKNWAIPHLMWKVMQDKKRMKERQLKLDGTFLKVKGPREFMHNGVLHMVS